MGWRHDESVSISYWICDFLFLIQPSRSELESSVKNYRGALFRSCSSVVEGNIRMQLFIQHVTKWFANADPFSEASALVAHSNPSAEGDHLQESPVRSATPTQTFREYYPPQVAGFSGSARPGRESPPTSSFCTCRLRFGTPHPSEGWYVVYHAAIPGIYQGL